MRYEESFLSICAAMLLIWAWLRPAEFGAWVAAIWKAMQ